MSRPVTQVGVCDFELCDRLKWSKGLCQGHYRQQRQGKPLTPIRGYREGSGEPSESRPRSPKVERACKIEDCLEPVWAKEMCMSHYSKDSYERRKNSQKSRKGIITLAQGFSTERHCSKCNQTKDWKEYHLEQKMCADCWREHLSVRHDVYPDATGRKVRQPASTFEDRWQQLLDDIATQIQ